MTQIKKSLNSKTLRSARWFESDDMRGFAHRQRMQQIGWRREDFIGKPVIAIINTWSDISTCHSYLHLFDPQSGFTLSSPPTAPQLVADDEQVMI